MKKLTVMMATAALAFGLFAGCATSSHGHDHTACKACCKDNCAACCKDAAACAACCGKK